MTINLSLILWTPRIQKQLPLSVFVFIDSLVVSPLQDAGGYVISRQNNLELRLGCHTCWLSYFTLVCLWCGRTVARSVYSHVITKFSIRGVDLLSYGAPHARAWSSCSMEPLNNLAIFIQGSRFYGHLEFANSIFFVSVVFGQRQTWPIYLRWVNYTMDRMKLFLCFSASWSWSATRNCFGWTYSKSRQCKYKMNRWV